MLPLRLTALCVAVQLAAISVAAAQQPPDPTAGATTLPLWPKDRVPGKVTELPEEQKPDTGDKVVRLTNVSQPSITLYKAKAAGASKPAPAIVICPGGGYGILAYNKEGTDVAAWLNSIGITGVVLKYRVPGNRDGAFQDVQRAMRLVRAHAADWDIDPKRVGVMGFSAGGHLAARLSTNSNQPAYGALDDADKLACRPDFVVLVYPAYLEKDGQLVPELPVSADLPATLIVHTEDDHTFIAGSKVYHAALEAAHAQNDFLLFQTGGHGYGLRSTKEVSVWPDRCKEWLAKIGVP